MSRFMKIIVILGQLGDVLPTGWKSHSTVVQRQVVGMFSIHRTGNWTLQHDR